MILRFSQLLLLLSFTNLVRAGDAPPAFTPEIQGTWHLLIAQSGFVGLAEATPAMWGTKVTFTDRQFTWNNPADGKSPWLAGDYQRAPEPEKPDPKPKLFPNELIGAVSGSLCPNPGAGLSAKWRLTDYGTLLVVFQREDPSKFRSATYQQDVLFALRREPVPAIQPADPAKDPSRIVGDWSVLCELDDANSTRTRPGGHVVFSADQVEKLGGGNTKSKPIQGSGGYKLLPPEAKYGRIDLIENREGRSPGLYAFCGDDLLYVVYPEDQDNRIPPDQRKAVVPLQSDGNRNLWVLHRRPAKP
ncbi:hypothetical protein LBMAG53_25890 [Planctomycetota bacterium]|nr:hypothetical protein LBMAG53_25890 [Planctomycetota bacterium]